MLGFADDLAAVNSAVRLSVIDAGVISKCANAQRLDLSQGIIDCSNTCGTLARPVLFEAGHLVARFFTGLNPAIRTGLRVCLDRLQGLANGLLSPQSEQKIRGAVCVLGGPEDFVLVIF